MNTNTFDIAVVVGASLIIIGAVVGAFIFGVFN